MVSITIKIINRLNDNKLLNSFRSVLFKQFAVGKKNCFTHITANQCKQKPLQCSILNDFSLIFFFSSRLYYTIYMKSKLFSRDKNIYATTNFYEFFMYIFCAWLYNDCLLVYLFVNLLFFSYQHVRFPILIWFLSYEYAIKPNIQITIKIGSIYLSGGYVNNRNQFVRLLCYVNRL